MLNLFRRRQPAGTIVSLYGAIVAQARTPAFYAELGVPDTMDGRFDMIVLHLALAMRRLRAGDAASAQAMQELFDIFCRDMDHNLREIGLSDVGVPRKMRKFGEAFYGRAKVYDQALDAHDAAALADALGRNIFRRPDGASDGAARCLAAYVEASDATLAGQEPATIAGGTIRFPEFCVAQVAR